MTPPALETKESPSRIPSIGELVIQLKQRHSNPNRYVGGFYLSKKPLLEKYEEMIQEEAIKLHEKLENDEQLRLIIKKNEKNSLQSIVQKIHQFGSDVDYLGLAPEDRDRFSQLGEEISQKSLDTWSDEEKIIYRFWHNLPKYGMDKPKTDDRPKQERRDYLLEEQVRLLNGIRWAIVGFALWFILQAWIIPNILSSSH